MASNKNQHFVPRCYLKAFADEPSHAAINLFNIDRMLFIGQAPLKHQCSGNYFYGKDILLEKALQSTEGAYARTLAEVVKPGYRLANEHRSLFRRFWLLQHMRTEAASVRAIEMTAAMGGAAGVPSQEFRMNVREAVQTSMRAFVERRDSIDDLKICLLRNRTAVPFVTSDDPAVLTNRWYLESPRTKGRSFGLYSSGVLVLLPLNPEILCLGFDGDVYSVPHENGWVAVKREADVHALNQHQFFNCRANIYVKDAANADLVREAYAAAEPLRPKARYKLNYAILDGRNGEYSRYRVVEKANAPKHTNAIVHVQAVPAVPSTWPWQLKWRSNGVVYTNDTGVGYLRQAWRSRSGGPAFRKERSH
jgi:hypothetical protein